MIQNTYSTLRTESIYSMGRIHSSDRTDSTNINDSTNRIYNIKSTDDEPDTTHSIYSIDNTHKMINRNSTLQKLKIEGMIKLVQIALIIKTILMVLNHRKYRKNIL